MQDPCDTRNSSNSNKLVSNVLKKTDPILCIHCKRTVSNGIRCLGMCVADNDYQFIKLYNKLNLIQQKIVVKNKKIKVNKF